MMFRSRQTSTTSSNELTERSPTVSPILSGSLSKMAAIVMPCSAKIGETVGDLRVSSFDDVVEICRERNIIVGVIAVPAESAQEAAQGLVDAGVKIILNYSEALLDVPADVNVHTSNPAVDLLYALYFHLT